MLVKVEVRTRRGNLLVLPLDDVSDGFILEDIEGLDPVKATLVSSSFANLDGEQYQSSKRTNRNIKIRMELDPGVSQTVRGLRRQLYQYFMPKTEVLLRFFMEDGLEADIVGWVESLDSAMFTKEPAVDISIVCFEPDFYDRVPVVETGMSTSDVSPRTIDYEGTVETGIKIVVEPNRTMDGFTIYHTPPNDEVRTMDFVADLILGDVVTISTVPGAKSATLLRSGTSSSILYGIPAQPRWIQLEQGLNQIKVYAEGAGVPVSLEYIVRYGGL